MAKKYPFPSSSDHDPEREAPKRPEFIDLGEGEQHTGSEERWQESPFPEQETLSHIHNLKNVQFSFALRILSLFLGILAGIWAFGAFLVALPFAAITLLTLGYAETAKNYASIFWRMGKKATVFSVGFFISFFSPVLGLGLILFSFILNNEPEKVNRFAGRWMR